MSGGIKKKPPNFELHIKIQTYKYLFGPVEILPPISCCFVRSCLVASSSDSFIEIRLRLATTDSATPLHSIFTPFGFLSLSPNWSSVPLFNTTSSPNQLTARLLECRRKGDSLLINPPSTSLHQIQTKLSVNHFQVKYISTSFYSSA